MNEEKAIKEKQWSHSFISKTLKDTVLVIGLIRYSFVMTLSCHTLQTQKLNSFKTEISRQLEVL